MWQIKQKRKDCSKAVQQKRWNNCSSVPRPSLFLMPRWTTLCKAAHGNKCLNLGQIRSVALKEKQVVSENASSECFLWQQKWENIHADLTKLKDCPQKSLGKFINGWDEDGEVAQRWWCSSTSTVPVANILGEKKKKNPSSVLIYHNIWKIINNNCILQQQYPLLLQSRIAKDEAQHWPSQPPNTATKNTYIAVTAI